MKSDLLFYIVLMALITYFTRFPMLLLSSRVNLPRSVERGLRMVPIGVFTSLTIPQIVFHFDQGVWNPEYAIAGVFALIVGLWKKQIYLSLITGIITVLVIREIGEFLL